MQSQQSHREYIKGVVAGALVVLGMVLLTGAVVSQTYNTAGDATKSYVNVACSSDGETVYVIDVGTVYKSSNGGHDWTVVLKKNSQP